MTLYHFTCRHVASRISRRGFLRPWPQPALGGVAFVWLTDLEAPDPDALGLTSHTLACNRLERRYVVHVDDAQPWDAVKGALPTVPASFERGRQPEHWFVVRRSVFAVLDLTYRLPEARA